MYEFNGFNNSESLINCWKKKKKKRSISPEFFLPFQVAPSRNLSREGEGFIILGDSKSPFSPRNASESLGEEGRSLSFEPSKVLKAWNIDSRIVPSKVENVTESKGVCNSYGNFTARNFSIVCATSCGPLAASLGPISRREKCHLNEIEMKKERGFPCKGREEKGRL